MGLFSVQRRPRYRQENAMGNANAMASLLGMKAEQMNGISEAVDNYGQSRTRGELATLMGQEEYAGLTPEQAQAKIFGLTQGRDLGKSGEFMMTSSLGNKEDIQANKMKQDAASLLFSRQNSQIAQRHANALSQDKSNAQLLGLSTDGETSNTRKVAENNEEIRQIEEALGNDTVSDSTKSELRMKRDELFGEVLKMTTKKASSAQIGALIGVDKDGNKTYRTGNKTQNNVQVKRNAQGIPGFGPKGDDFSPETAFKTANKMGRVVKNPYEKGEPTTYRILGIGGDNDPIRESIALRWIRANLAGK